MSKFTELSWEEALRSHQRYLAGLHQGPSGNALDYKAFTRELDALRQKHESKLVHRCVARLQPAFEQLESLQSAFSSIAQAHSTSTVVWGILQIVVTVSQTNTSMFSRSKTVGRTYDHGYAPQPLRYFVAVQCPAEGADLSIHKNYVECCVCALKFYRHGTLRNLLNFMWKDVRRTFTNVKGHIESQIATFERESRIEIDEILVSHARQQVVKKAPRTSIFSVPFSENEYFCGREDVLLQIHSVLSPPEKANSSRQRSCLLHAMGGMGKTQCALAYAYRHRSVYPYVFWLGAQKEPDLGVSFSNLATTLELQDVDNLGQGRKINLVREWLETTEEKWLLIFDNVESFDTIRPYWPSASHRGSILVTSQLAGLAQVIRSHIPLQPLPVEVASELLLDLLQINSPTADDKQAVSTIANQVGGLPIAIAHIAGSMFSSQLTTQEAINLFDKQRLQVIWATERTWSTHVYDQQLNKVWDIALRELTPDALHLLDILSLLSPDAIQEAMLMGAKDIGVFSEDFLERIFPEIRSNLSRRQLVQRNTARSEPYLSLHRSLQINLRNSLGKNPQKYDAIFREAVWLVHKVFPVMNKTMKCENENWGVYEKYQPHVQTLQTIARKSPIPIGKVPVFAQLLADAGNYYWERGLLEIGIASCEDSVSTWQEVHNPDLMALSQPLTLWGLMAIEMGITQRKIGMDCFIRSLNLRNRYLQQADRGGTRDEKLLYCNAWSDYSICLLEFGYYATAERYLRLTLALKSQQVTEVTYPQMFGISYGHVATMYASRRMYNEAKAFSARCVKMAALTYETHSAAMQKFLFFQANLWLEAGDLEAALESHLSILKERVAIFGIFGTHTRYSYYALGATYYALGNLEMAEYSAPCTVKLYTR
ncbi:hypothetical protein A1O3_05696 [Capronia epimyces CBS 606.96]|uniref:DUF7779 domain-containing protein n=1 Tax=Capronia epimyces CBS 606.96 TaxID=1182542 RepID=W9Y707_9EURO|nr:uncharacterized protein A1O3_05696 [Capronia epimyces CBS 606.96]EXJ85021.1 hypothetical protein A1O3_05696 [Capronia epimyces CBS 606.96]